jgi:hypothetical protein
MFLCSRRLLVAALVVTAVAATGIIARAAKTNIRTESDPKFSFAGLRTWAWHPDAAGEVRLAYSSSADPNKVHERVRPVIVEGVTREMAARGFTETADHPDLYVHYYVLVAVQSSAQTMGQFLPATPEWGLPPFTASTTALSIYPVGTFLMDMTVPGREGIVWRGAAEREVDLERPDTERRKILLRAIADLLKQFPPKPKK